MPIRGSNIGIGHYTAISRRSENWIQYSQEDQKNKTQVVMYL